MTSNTSYSTFLEGSSLLQNRHFAFVQWGKAQNPQSWLGVSYSHNAVQQGAPWVPKSNAVTATATRTVFQLAGPAAALQMCWSLLSLLYLMSGSILQDRYDLSLLTAKNLQWLSLFFPSKPIRMKGGGIKTWEAGGIPPSRKKPAHSFSSPLFCLPFGAGKATYHDELKTVGN